MEYTGRSKGNKEKWTDILSIIMEALEELEDKGAEEIIKDEVTFSQEKNLAEAETTKIKFEKAFKQTEKIYHLAMTVSRLRYKKEQEDANLHLEGFESNMAVRKHTRGFG